MGRAAVLVLASGLVAWLLRPKATVKADASAAEGPRPGRRGEMHSPRELDYPARDDIELVDVLQAIGDPVRLQLVRILDQADGAMCAARSRSPSASRPGAITSRCYAKPASYSAHVDGTRKYYTLRHDDLEARFPGLLDSVLRDGERQPV